MYQGKVPKQTGVITTTFKDEQVKVVQGLASIANDRMHQAFRRSGQEGGALIRTFRQRDPFQVVLLPMEKTITQARQVAQSCGDDAYGVVMTRKGYAIRVTPETRSSVEAQINTDIAECLGDAFHELQADNPNVLEFVVNGIHARMTRVQLIQTMMDSLAWAIKPVKRLGKERDGRCNWLVRALDSPKKNFAKIQHGFVVYGITIKTSSDSDLVRSRTTAFDTLPPLDTDSGAIMSDEFPIPRD